MRKGYLNLDFIKAESVDVVRDIEQYPWPFQDNTFEEVYASHLLEHLQDFRRAMDWIFPAAEVLLELEVEK